MTALVASVELPLDQPPVIESGPEVAAPRRPPRFPAFDGLRAIAAVTVVVVHVGFVSGLTPRNSAGVGMYTARMEIGVSVFFLISGFLLYRPFVVAHLAAGPRPRTGAFWVRRLLRIIPAYWLVLFVTTSVFHAGPGIGPGGWRAYASHYLLLQIYFPSQDLKGISAAWSLCVEITFYLFIPLYAALMGRRRSRRSDARTLRLELGGLLVLTAISYGWRFFVLQFQSHHSPYFRLATIWLPAYLDLFALGMGLAVVSAWMHHRDRETAWLSSRWFPWLSWACALVCFWAVSNIGTPVVPVYFESDLDLARQALYGLFAFFLLLPAVFGPQGRGTIRRFLQWWPMASLGVISYGIYLWHETWIYQILRQGHFHVFNLEFWAYFLSVLGLSIASASLSYFIVEKPALRLKNSIAWWRRPAPAPSPDRKADDARVGPTASGDPRAATERVLRADADGDPPDAPTGPPADRPGRTSLPAG